MQKEIIKKRGLSKKRYPFRNRKQTLKYIKRAEFLKYVYKKQKHPSPPFTRNYLTHKTLSKKVKGEGLKTLFYIYARQGKMKGVP